MAVLTALFATVLLMGLGLAIALLGTTEAALAAQDRAARTLRQASLAAAHLAVADLRVRTSWSAVLAAGPVAPLSGAPGRTVAATLAPPSPWDGSPLDLVRLTADVQGAADTEGDPQAWRLFESGRLDALVPGAATGPWYVAVWVADDGADGDGDPSVDSNGIVALRAVAFGPRQARVTTAVSVSKTVVAGEAGQVRILTVRPVS